MVFSLFSFFFPGFGVLVFGWFLGIVVLELASGGVFGGLAADVFIQVVDGFGVFLFGGGFCFGVLIGWCLRRHECEGATCVLVGFVHGSFGYGLWQIFIWIPNWS